MLGSGNTKCSTHTKTCSLTELLYQPHKPRHCNRQFISKPFHSAPQASLHHHRRRRRTALTAALTALTALTAGLALGGGRRRLPWRDHQRPAPSAGRAASPPRRFCRGACRAVAASPVAGAAPAGAALEAAARAG